MEGPPALSRRSVGFLAVISLAALSSRGGVTMRAAQGVLERAIRASEQDEQGARRMQRAARIGAEGPVRPGSHQALLREIAAQNVAAAQADQTALRKLVRLVSQARKGTRWPVSLGRSVLASLPPNVALAPAAAGGSLGALRDMVRDERWDMSDRFWVAWGGTLPWEAGLAEVLPAEGSPGADDPSRRPRARPRLGALAEAAAAMEESSGAAPPGQVFLGTEEAIMYTLWQMGWLPAAERLAATTHAFRRAAFRVPNVDTVPPRATDVILRGPLFGRLRRLDAHDARRITDASVGRLVHLTDLNASGSLAITEASIGQLPRLRRLDVSGRETFGVRAVANPGLRALVARNVAHLEGLRADRLPLLTSLELSEFARLPVAQIRLLTALTSLRLDETFRSGARAGRYGTSVTDMLAAGPNPFARLRDLRLYSYAGVTPGVLTRGGWVTSQLTSLGLLAVSVDDTVLAAAAPGLRWLDVSEQFAADLRGLAATDESLRLLTGLTRLRLDVSSAPHISNASMSLLTAMRDLALDRVRGVTPAALRAMPGLTSLSASAPLVSDAALTGVTGLTRLAATWMTPGLFADEAAQDPVPRPWMGPGLRDLEVFSAPGMRDYHFVDVPGLERLKLGAMEQVRGSFLRSLRGLTTLDVAVSRVPARYLGGVVSLTDLTVDASQAADQHMRTLTRLERLVVVDHLVLRLEMQPGTLRMLRRLRHLVIRPPARYIDRASVLSLPHLVSVEAPALSDGQESASTQDLWRR